MHKVLEHFKISCGVEYLSKTNTNVGMCKTYKMPLWNCESTVQGVNGKRKDTFGMSTSFSVHRSIGPTWGKEFEEVVTRMCRVRGNFTCPYFLNCANPQEWVGRNWLLFWAVLTVHCCQFLPFLFFCGSTKPDCDGGKHTWFNEILASREPENSLNYKDWLHALMKKPARMRFKTSAETTRTVQFWSIHCPENKIDLNEGEYSQSRTSCSKFLFSCATRQAWSYVSALLFNVFQTI